MCTLRSGRPNRGRRGAGCRVKERRRRRRARRLRVGDGVIRMPKLIARAGGGGGVPLRKKLTFSTPVKTQIVPRSRLSAVCRLILLHTALFNGCQALRTPGLAKPFMGNHSVGFPSHHFCCASASSKLLAPPRVPAALTDDRETEQEGLIIESAAVFLRAKVRSAK